jgi:hypothetical protein
MCPFDTPWECGTELDYEKAALAWLVEHDCLGRGRKRERQLEERRAGIAKLEANPPTLADTLTWLRGLEENVISWLGHRRLRNEEIQERKQNLVAVRERIAKLEAALRLPDSAFESFARNLLAAFLAQQMGASPTTAARQYVNEEAPIGTYWLNLARRIAMEAPSQIENALRGQIQGPEGRPQ